MYSRVLVLFAFTILIVNSQLITTKRIKSTTRNSLKLPKNAPFIISNPCNCPVELTRGPKCPCGCANPNDCRGPIINSLKCPERPCKCGDCQTIGRCRCPEPIDTAYTFLPELLTAPVKQCPINAPLDFTLPCGCQNQCQCRAPKDTCPVIDPNYSPIITESYLTPDLSTYRVAPINVPTFLIDASCVPDTYARSLNPVYEIFVPTQECPAPPPVSMPCGCQRACGCQNVKQARPVTETRPCSCGRMPQPVLGSPKYLRQVTIQPPFL